jgi:hypothetical protein
MARRSSGAGRGAQARRVGVAVACAAALITSWSTAGLGSAQGVEPVAAITVTPATGLVDGQEVTVTGTGFVDDTDALVLQCPRTVVDMASPAACELSTARGADVDGAGGFSSPLTVRRTLFVQGSGSVDCAVAPGCHVLVVGSDPQAGGPFTIAVAALTFAAEPDRGGGGATACASPYAPYAHRADDGASTIALPGVPVEDATPWRLAGAELRVAADPESLTLEVTLDATTELFTTLPNPPGRNYPNRAGGPAEAFGQGSVEIARAGDGAVYVVLERSDSGEHSLFAWRFDDPCARPATLAVTAAPAFTG